jgi:acetyl-CoA carboxylase biotin carboxyl carrier protein
MEVREIKALLILMQEYGLVELEIDDKKKGKVRLVRSEDQAGAVAPKPSARKIPATSPAPPVAPPPLSIAKADGKPAPPQLADNQRLVTSPMVGTFYRAASPDADPFVEEGASVRKGQTLCIIEAMKMMNEIEAEVAGRIVKVLCDNAQPVEYGQPLLVIEVG